MMKRLRRFIENKILNSIICLSLSFSFMFFIYAPLELYLTNTSEFWFDMNDLLPVILTCFIISNLFLIGLEMILYRIFYVRRSKLYFAIHTVFQALFVGLYIQGNYIPRNYGVLNGTSIDWSSYILYAVASVAVWFLVVIFTIVLNIKFQKHIFQISKWLSMAIFVMLSAALISLFLNTDVDDIFTDENDSIVVTDKSVYNYSEDKNIIVLVLDSFDAEYLRVLLNEDEDTYSELLENFTFYTNAVGGYPTTKGSIPLILSGEWYENDVPYEEWVESIYSDDTELYAALKENGYTLGFYTMGSFLTNTDGYYENVFSGAYQVDNYKGFVSTLYKLISFEYVPHQLKRFFQVNTSDFDAYKILNPELNGLSAWTESDESFYDGLINGGLSTESTGNVFRFIHLYGMHPPYNFGENVIEDGNEYTYLDTAKGNMNEVQALLISLKENEIYDNTAIIIMADHGGGDLGSEMSCNPLLLVKGFDEHHDFETSHAAISWVDIYPTLVSWVTGTDSEDAVWNINDDQRIRRFLYYSWGNEGDWNDDYLLAMTEYYIVGDISDGSATIMSTGNQYFPGISSTEDKEGLRIPSSEDLDLSTDTLEISIPIDDSNSNFNDIYVSGLGDIETREDGTTYAWSEGNHTYFKLNPEGEQMFSYTFTVYYDEIYNPSDLTVSDSECMSIYAFLNGETSVTDIQFTENSMTFTIPVDNMQGESVDILIRYPYAEINEETGQKNALAITGIKLELLAAALENSLTLDFSETGKIGSTTISGWNEQESSGIWSTEESSITFLSDDSSDIAMQIDYSSLTEDAETSVYMNDNFVCVLREENAQNIVIPKEYLNPAMQTLKFLTEDATTPQAIWMNGDSRTLGIFVKEINLSKSE